MIYAKMYLNDKGDIVFDSVKENVDGECLLAGRKLDKNNKPYVRQFTTIYSAKHIVASPESQKMFKQLMDRSNPNRSVNGFVGDFEFYKQENSGSSSDYVFSYKPSVINETMKTLSNDDKIVVCTNKGVSYHVLDKFTLSDNEFIKNLDITNPVPENNIPIKEEAGHQFE